jgi:hypothetical protein
MDKTNYGVGSGFEVRTSNVRDDLPRDGEDTYEHNSPVLLTNELLMPLHIFLPNGTHWKVCLSKSGKAVDLYLVVDSLQPLKTDESAIKQALETVDGDVLSEYLKTQNVPWGGKKE